MSNIHEITATCIGLLATTYWLIFTMIGIVRGSDARICVGIVMMLLTTAATVAWVLI